MKRFTVITLSINSALLLCGCAIVGYGLSLKFGDEFFISILRKGRPWDCDNVLLIAGAFIATGGIMRLAGTFKMNKRIMLWSIVSTALAFISALAVIIMVYGFYYEPKEYAVKAVTEQIKENYGEKGEGKNSNEITPATEAIDNIQKNYKCCGANGYTDWQGSKWSSETELRVPKSCCNTIDYKTCQSKSGSASTIFQQNCSKELENWAVKNIPMLGGLGFVLLILAIGAGVLTAFMIKHM